MISVESFTEHKRDLWLSDGEMIALKQRASAEIGKIRPSSRSLDQDDYADLLYRRGTVSYLGLERYLLETTVDNMEVRQRRLRRAILFEQDRQWAAGVLDPDILANISEAESEWSRRRAGVIGLLHASVARQTQ